MELTEGLKGQGQDVDCVVADMADEDQVKHMVGFVVERFGKLDILVNTAATTAHPEDLDVAHLSVAAWDQSFAVNARGTMLACKYAIPAMLEVGGGSIINYSSGTASAGDMRYTAYACSKAAIHTLTYYIATQYGRQGIRCNTLAIGLVRTAVNEAAIPEPFATIYRENHVIVAHQDGQWWFAALKVTGDRKEVYLQTFHRSNPGQIARLTRRGTLVRNTRES